MTIRLILMGAMAAAVGTLVCSILFAARGSSPAAYFFLIESLAFVAGGITAASTSLSGVCLQGESLGQGPIGFVIVAVVTAVVAIWPWLLIGLAIGLLVRWARGR